VLCSEKKPMRKIFIAINLLFSFIHSIIHSVNVYWVQYNRTCIIFQINNILKCHIYLFIQCMSFEYLLIASYSVRHRRYSHEKTIWFMTSRHLWSTCRSKQESRQSSKMLEILWQHSSVHGSMWEGYWKSQPIQDNSGVKEKGVRKSISGKRVMFQNLQWSHKNHRKIQSCTY
jgi:hypothetical protein